MGTIRVRILQGYKHLYHFHYFDSWQWVRSELGYCKSRKWQWVRSELGYCKKVFPNIEARLTEVAMGTIRVRILQVMHPLPPDFAGRMWQWVRSELGYCKLV